MTKVPNDAFGALTSADCAANALRVWVYTKDVSSGLAALHADWAHNHLQELAAAYGYALTPLDVPAQEAHRAHEARVLGNDPARGPAAMTTHRDSHAFRSHPRAARTAQPCIAGGVTLSGPARTTLSGDV